MASIRELQTKSDSRILTDIQEIGRSNITAFAWNGSAPRVTFTNAPTAKVKFRLSKYFAAHSKAWIEI